MDESIVSQAVKRHLPRGWKVKWVRGRRHPEKRFFYSPDKGYVHGICDSEAKTIYCVPPTTPYNLCVFLHECGHAQMRHYLMAYDDDTALCEFEAETYAIGAAHALGVTPPRRYILDAVRYVRNCIEEQSDSCIDEEVLDFALWAC